MKKYLGAISALLFFVGVLYVATTLNSNGSNAKFLDEGDYIDEYYYDSNYSQVLPYANITGFNLANWSNSSWYNFYNYTGFNYTVNINSAVFQGSVDNWNISGTIYLLFDAFGNDSYTPSWNQSQTWEYGVNATIEIQNSWPYDINYGRSMAIYKSDISNFLRAWVINVVNPLLASNSSSNTTIVFPEMNLTGYDLNNWLPGWYANYTAAGYFVDIYNISSSLYVSGGDVYGPVSFAFIAFGNDTNDTSCYYYGRCNQITVYSNATIYVNGVKNNYTQPDYYQDWSLRVNASDIQNFLRAYYVGVLVPNITYYYNISSNTTSNTTIYLPDFSNDTQISIDCSQAPWYYCSNASNQSFINTLGIFAYNMSITVDSSGYGNFNGMMKVPYVANLVNFTSTWEGKESIVSNLQGNATMWLWGSVSPRGNDSYYIQLNSYAYVSTVYDRNYFVQNAVQQLYQDRFYYYVQYWVNNFVSNY